MHVLIKELSNKSLGAHITSQYLSDQKVCVVIDHRMEIKVDALNVFIIYKKNSSKNKGIFDHVSAEQH